MVQLRSLASMLPLSPEQSQASPCNYTFQNETLLKQIMVALPLQLAWRKHHYQNVGHQNIMTPPIIILCLRSVDQTQLTEQLKPFTCTQSRSANSKLGSWNVILSKFPACNLNFLQMGWGSTLQITQSGVWPAHHLSQVWWHVMGWTSWWLELIRGLVTQSLCSMLGQVPCWVRSPWSSRVPRYEPSTFRVNDTDKLSKNFINLYSWNAKKSQ
jgi:hypothetical protein